MVGFQFVFWPFRRNRGRSDPRRLGALMFTQQLAAELPMDDRTTALFRRMGASKNPAVYAAQLDVVSRLMTLLPADADLANIWIGGGQCPSCAIADSAVAVQKGTSYHLCKNCQTATRFDWWRLRLE